MGLEDEHVEVVVRHDRAPVGLGVLPVETLPYLQSPRQTSAVRQRRTHAHAAPSAPHLADDELGRLDLVAACEKKMKRRARVSTPNSHARPVVPRRGGNRGTGDKVDGRSHCVLRKRKPRPSAGPKRERRGAAV